MAISLLQNLEDPQKDFPSGAVAITTSVRKGCDGERCALREHMVPCPATQTVPAGDAKDEGQASRGGGMHGCYGLRNPQQVIVI